MEMKIDFDKKKIYMKHSAGNGRIEFDKKIMGKQGTVDQDENKKKKKKKNFIPTQ